MNQENETANVTTIKIARDFSFTPGFRNRRQGNYSGEEFRENWLEPHFSEGNSGKVIIDFDGTAGYPTSFLEEAFGGLVRKFGYTTVLNKLEFISREDAVILDDVKKYMKEAGA